MVSVWILLVLAIISIYYLLRKRHKWPPGPQGLPFVGNLFQLDPVQQHLTLQKWGKQYGDVFYIKLLGQNIVIVNSYEGAREVLIQKTSDFAGRPYFFRAYYLQRYHLDLVFTNYSEEWNKVKKQIMNGLKGMYTVYICKH